MYGHSRSQPLSFDEIRYERHVCLEDLLSRSADNDIGHFLEVDSNYCDKIRQKTKNFPFGPEHKNKNKEDFIEHIKKFKPKTYIPDKYFFLGL